MCLDARHVVPQDGWRFRSAAEAQAAFPCHWQELEPGVWRFWNEPVSGIGPSAYLIQTEAGNMGFEGCPVFSEAALDQIERLGGMQVLSASHPHSYGALVQLQDRFDPELCLPAADLHLERGASGLPGPMTTSSSLCRDWSCTQPPAISTAMPFCSTGSGRSASAETRSNSNSTPAIFAAR